MSIYAALIFIVLLCRLFVSHESDSSKQYKYENNYLIIICLILILLAAFRGKTVGADTAAYMADYRNLQYESFEFLTIRYKSYWTYYYLSKVFSLLSLPCSAWFGFVEATYLFPLYLLTKRYSKDYILSILIYITCGLFMFSLAGLKQTLGMGLIMLSFITFIDKRYIVAALLFITGYLSHPSVAIFAIGYILYFFRDTRYFKVIITVGLILTLGLGQWLFSTLISLNGDEHFESYLNYDNSYTSTTLIFYFIIVALSLVGIKSYYHDNPTQMKLMFGLSILAYGFQSLASFSPNAFRLAFLFSPFFMILLPNSIESIESERDRRWIYITTAVVLSFYFLYTNRNNQYTFA